MFDSDRYTQSLTERLKEIFRERLLYVGLQGSYLRGEATADSDIDIMVVIRDITIEDLTAYRQIIESLENPEKSCGFICGAEELLHWNPLEICHLLNNTRDCYGVLAELVPAYTKQDTAIYVKMSLGNLYHEICHRYIHAPQDSNEALLPGTYKQVFFILQNLHYLETGRFIGTRQELLVSLNGMDRLVLETAVSLGNGDGFDFAKAFSLLHSWCREALIRTSSVAGEFLQK